VTSSSQSGIGGAVKAIVVPPGPRVHLSAFQLPGGNVGCTIRGGVAQCAIKLHTWLARGLAACSATSQVGAQVGPAGRGQLICGAPALLDPHAPTLQEGKINLFGTVWCEAVNVQMLCTNAATDSGFVLAKYDYGLH
jgi:hypothetical protein